MHFDLDQIDPKIGYKLMTSTVTPRPIAWVTTLAPQGTVNAAPYSFFNVMGHTPPTLVLGLLADPDKGFKDTAANILDGGEFVVNLVSEPLAAQMNITTMDAPRGFSELDAAGLTPLASRHVAPPQIAEAPVSFECQTFSTLVTGPHQAIAIGRILSIRIDDAFVLDAERGYVDTPAMQLIARMHGSGWYARSTALFQMTRPTFADWQSGAMPGADAKNE
ncbi:flavin reductase family protein [Paracoccus jeotgali]|uniref:Flavin reductase family protein n=1 Tax=Paracoccus jeotgali TaxID=2065379 RepID=A0A2K9MHS8_9RHOB|nr:flavin reductase family protein [Paracoccus jeotgali]AUM75164.1 flavin reductase family protein [Paracoccus jeotgali]